MTQELENAGRSRAPVIIALDLTDDPFTDDELTRATCHLIIALTPAQVASIAALAGDVLAGDSSIPEIVAAGTRVWARFTEAEPRLRVLPERIAPAGLGQPVAWCGRPELLDRLRVPLQIAHTGAPGPRGFLFLASGHYLVPVQRSRAARTTRTMRPREWDKDPTIGELDLRDPPGAADEGDDRLRSLDRAEVAVIVHPPDRPVLTELDRVMRGKAGPPTRAVVVFGGPTDVAQVDTLLTVVPFVCTAEAALATPELRAALRAAVRDHAGTSALACIVAGVQAAWVGEALDRGDAAACRLGLAVTSWSWIGLPLFSRSFGEVEPAAHPHLMVLRSIATRGWYFDRRERIEDAYQARTLADAPPQERFHLYLSGRGRHGQELFPPQRLRPDRRRPGPRRRLVPGRRAELLLGERRARIREETIAAIAEQDGPGTVEAVRQLGGDLGDFLKGAVGELRAHDELDGFDEIAVFVDQLERTFESGDEPNPFLLESISEEVVDLLRKVGTGGGVRVFVASRKQYLPGLPRLVPGGRRTAGWSSTCSRASPTSSSACGSSSGSCTGASSRSSSAPASR